MNGKAIAKITAWIKAAIKDVCLLKKTPLLNGGRVKITPGDNKKKRIPQIVQNHIYTYTYLWENIRKY